MAKTVSESEFYMWRTIFALAHADHVISEEERKFMHKTLGSVNFSDEQKKTLEKDMIHAQSIPTMFARITEQEDRSRFFYFARLLTWSDGNFDGAEQKIVADLGRAHMKTVDFDQMIGKADFSLEGEQQIWIREDVEKGVHKTGFTGVLDRFLGRIKG